MVFESSISITPFPKIVFSFAYLHYDNRCVCNSTLSRVLRRASLICCSNRIKRVKALKWGEGNNSWWHYWICKRYCFVISVFVYIIACPVSAGRHDYHRWHNHDLCLGMCCIMDDHPAVFHLWYVHSHQTQTTRQEKKDFISIDFFFPLK